MPQAHVDYTLNSGPGRLREVLPEEAESLQNTPYAVIQVQDIVHSGGGYPDQSSQISGKAVSTYNVLLHIGTTTKCKPKRMQHCTYCTYPALHDTFIFAEEHCSMVVRQLFWDPDLVV